LIINCWDAHNTSITLPGFYSNTLMILLPAPIINLLETLNVPVSAQSSINSLEWEQTVYDCDVIPKGQKLLPIWERFYVPVQDAGGACIFGLSETRLGERLNKPESALTIAFPATVEYFLKQLDTVRFGYDAYISPATLQHPWEAANSSEHIMERREMAKRLFGEMSHEQNVAVCKLSKSSATVAAVGHFCEEWARKWALKTWDFYCDKYRSETEIYAPDLHAFTREEAVRLGCKHGLFKFGGYG
jgi:hypothetical protein